MDGKGFWDVSIQAEGRTLSYTYHFKRPWPNPGAFSQWLAGYQQTVLKGHCSDDKDFVLRIAKATETHSFYNSNDEWMTSFTISPASKLKAGRLDCELQCTMHRSDFDEKYGGGTRPFGGTITGDPHE